MLERASKWPSLCGADEVEQLPAVKPVKGAGTSESILWRDAERTFKTGDVACVFFCWRRDPAGGGLGACISACVEVCACAEDVCVGQRGCGSVGSGCKREREREA